MQSSSSYSNSSGLGANSTVTGSNQVQLGDSATIVYTYSTATRSDVRDKTDIRDTTLGLDFVTRLRPVDYRFDYRDDYRPARPKDTDPEVLSAWENACKLSNIRHDGSRKRTRFHHGLIAQEVRDLLTAQGIDFGGFQDHSVNGGDDVLSISYDELIAPIIRSVQELNQQLAELRARHEALLQKLAQ